MSDKPATIIQVLQKIQTEVNAPKKNQGRFGKSRSAEDIIAAAKPVLAKYEAALTLSDKIVQVGERNYVQATAVLHYNDQVIPVSANAWEGDINRGLDASQVTGMASSYARKYAMGGLLAVDDTKDADHLLADNTKVVAGTPKTTKQVVERYATEKQIKLIFDKLKHRGSKTKEDAAYVLADEHGISDVTKLTIEDASLLIDELEGSDD